MPASRGQVPRRCDPVPVALGRDGRPGRGHVAGSRIALSDSHCSMRSTSSPVRRRYGVNTGTGRQRPLAQRDVVVLADGEDALVGRSRDRRPRRSRRRRARSGRSRPRRRRAGRPRARPASGPRPDRRQRHGRDRPAASPRSGRRRGSAMRGRQSSVSARWWKTSRAVTTPVGRPSSMIGMCRKPPTAILWMAIAIGSSWRRTTGSGVMKSRTVKAVERLPGDLHHRVAVGEDADEPAVDRDEDAVGLGCRASARSPRRPGVSGPTVSGGGAPSSSRCSPRSRPWNDEARLRDVRHRPGRRHSCRRPPRPSGSRSRRPDSASRPLLRRLFDRPGLAAVEDIVEVAGTALARWPRRSGPSISRSWVGRRDRAQDADRDRVLRARTCATA